MFSDRYYNECAPGNVHTQCPQPALAVVTFPVYVPFSLVSEAMRACCNHCRHWRWNCKGRPLSPSSVGPFGWTVLEGSSDSSWQLAKSAETWQLFSFGRCVWMCRWLATHCFLHLRVNRSSQGDLNWGTHPLEHPSVGPLTQSWSLLSWVFCLEWKISVAHSVVQRTSWKGDRKTESWRWEGHYEVLCSGHGPCNHHDCFHVCIQQHPFPDLSNLPKLKFRPHLKMTVCFCPSCYS